jgi:hypothetical protein
VFSSDCRRSESSFCFFAASGEPGAPAAGGGGWTLPSDNGGDLDFRA